MSDWGIFFCCSGALGCALSLSVCVRAVFGDCKKSACMRLCASVYLHVCVKLSVQRDEWEAVKRQECVS